MKLSAIKNVKQLHSEITQEMAKPLSDKQILALTKNQARLVTHDEIKHFSSIEELLGKHGACIILYVTKIIHPNTMFGHWCCVFKAPWVNGYSYFDPYGNKPDDVLKYMTPEAIEKCGNVPDLTHLLLDSGKKVVYNDAPLQHHLKGDAICGRVTGLRLALREMDGRQFASLMKSYEASGITSDDLATLLTWKY